MTSRSHSTVYMQVVVAEGAPDYGGHKLARALAEAGIESTAIADSAIFAMMARVNKVRILTQSFNMQRSG